MVILSVLRPRSGKHLERYRVFLPLGEVHQTNHLTRRNRQNILGAVTSRYAFRGTAVPDPFTAAAEAVEATNTMIQASPLFGLRSNPSLS